jgi:hypothetical protein
MFKVYWTDPDGFSHGMSFKDMSLALAFTQNMRAIGNTFVTMASENPHCTSKAGVDEVTDTANYDGWISRGRAP